MKGAATQQRRLALLAVLARAGDRGVSRTRLLQLFWPDEDDEERRRKALAQALYSLRRDLGDEAVITGTQELRLDGELLPHDVGLFAEHLRHGRHADAVALYTGSFLGGFHLAGAPAFERWAEEERRVLERDYLRALETLAAAAEKGGHTADAVQWRRKAAALDPLDSRSTLALMRALASNGEIAAAIRQAAIHETLIQQELELPPDREVVAYAATLRTQPELVVPVRDVIAAETVPVETPAPPSVDAEPAELEIVAELSDSPTPNPTPTPAPVPAPAPVPVPVPASAPSPSPSRRRVILAAVACAIFALVWLGWRTSLGRSATVNAQPVMLTASGAARRPNIAVGLIADFRGGSPSPVRALAALLATSLARGDGLRVVSAARLGELLYQGAAGDTTEAAYMAAARKAGAEELIDGSLYDPGDGLLRLDLRRVDVNSGTVRAALTIRATDLFALADSGTARLLDGFGVAPLRGSVAEVTTRSAAALRFYAEGMRAQAASDFESARRLFGEALREDSLFAMAAYEYALANPNRALLAEEMARAVALARRATTRERLVIQAGWASTMQLPGLTETADSLLLLDPNDPQALIFAAEGRLNLGTPTQALPLLARVIALDSSSLAAITPDRCYGCEAVRLTVRAHLDEDRPDAAIAAAQRWVDLQPRSAEAWATLSRVYDFLGRTAEGERALQRTLTLEPGYASGFVRRISNLLRAGRWAEAERAAREHTTLATLDQRLDGWWQLTTILRHQGRMREALEAARRFRLARDTADGGRMALNHAYLPALVLHDAGETRSAIALFDSMAAGVVRPGEHEANVRRLRTIALTAAADFTAQLGDTAALTARLRAVEAAGSLSGVARDIRAHHFVRGVLYKARGDRARAVNEWRSALAPPLRGYHSRANLELARALLADGQHEEAIRVIRPILRDVVDGIAVTQTEMHEVLAQAHNAAGRRDSAAVHRDWVRNAWSRGEPAYKARVQRLMATIR